MLCAQTLATQFYLEGDKLNINLIVILNLRCSGVLTGSGGGELGAVHGTASSPPPPPAPTNQGGLSANQNQTRSQPLIMKMMM